VKKARTEYPIFGIKHLIRLKNNQLRYNYENLRKIFKLIRKRKFKVNPLIGSNKYFIGILSYAKKNYSLYSYNYTMNIINEKQIHEYLEGFNTYSNNLLFHNNKFDYYYNFNKFLANLKFNHSFLLEFC